MNRIAGAALAFNSIRDTRACADEREESICERPPIDSKFQRPVKRATPLTSLRFYASASPNAMKPPIHKTTANES